MQAAVPARLGEVVGDGRILSPALIHALEESTGMFPAKGQCVLTLLTGTEIDEARGKCTCNFLLPYLGGKFTSFSLICLYRCTGQKGIRKISQMLLILHLCKHVVHFSGKRTVTFVALNEEE